MAVTLFRLGVLGIVAAGGLGSCSSGHRATHVASAAPPDAAAASGGAVSSRGIARAGELVLSPSADAYVSAGGAQHGYGPTLRIDGSPLTRSYLAFELASLPGRVRRATLRLYTKSGSRTGFQVEVAHGVGWRAQHVTRSPPPLAQSRVRALRSRAFRRGAWVSVDVTPLVKRRGTITLALLPVTSTEITLASAESGGTAPQLVVDTFPPPRRGPDAAGGRVIAPTRGRPVIAAAGDIACDPQSPLFHRTNGTGSDCRMRATSQLLLRLKPTAVLTLGDNQYEDNAYWKYRASYAPTWGRAKSVTHPAIGNHEYATRHAAGYFRYFGAAAGNAAQGWYSFDLGAWHIVELNSECGHVGGCGPRSPEEQWLRADLAAHPAACTLAYWHEPRFSSGQHGDAQQMATVWNDLVAAHADVVLSGHNHDYERFAPIGVTPQGTGGLGGAKSFQAPRLDPTGIREFVVGTGGKHLYGFPHAALPGEVVRNNATYGVLTLTLRPRGYDWRFFPVRNAPKAFSESGSGTCH